MSFCFSCPPSVYTPPIAAGCDAGLPKECPAGIVLIDCASSSTLRAQLPFTPFGSGTPYNTPTTISSALSTLYGASPTVRRALFIPINAESLPELQTTEVKRSACRTIKVPTKTEWAFSINATQYVGAAPVSGVAPDYITYISQYLAVNQNKQFAIGVISCSGVLRYFISANPSDTMPPLNASKYFAGFNIYSSATTESTDAGCLLNAKVTVTFPDGFSLSQPVLNVNDAAFSAAAWLPAAQSLLAGYAS